MPPLAGFSVCPAEQSLRLGHSGLGAMRPDHPCRARLPCWPHARGQRPCCARTDSPYGPLWNIWLWRADHSGLMLAARITLAHLSVWSAMNFPNSADVNDIG